MSKFWQHSGSSSDDDSDSSSSDSDSESSAESKPDPGTGADTGSHSVSDSDSDSDSEAGDGALRSGFWEDSSESSDSSDSDSDSDAQSRKGKGRSAFLKNANDSSSDDSSSDDSSDDSDDDDDDSSLGRSKKPKWQIKKKLQKQRQAKFRQRQQQNLAAAAGEVESLDSESDSKYTRYICDGCDSGIHTVRWHSTAVADFDLCQSCYGSSALTSSHGPFQPFAVKASHYEVQTFIAGNVMPSPWPPAVYERGGLGSWRLWLRHQLRCQAVSAPAPATLSAACCV